MSQHFLASSLCLWAQSREPHKGRQERPEPGWEPQGSGAEMRPPEMPEQGPLGTALMPWHPWDLQGHSLCPGGGTLAGKHGGEGAERRGEPGWSSDSIDTTPITSPALGGLLFCFQMAS